MALVPKTIYTFPLDGSAQTFPINFEYLTRGFVQITLIGKDRKLLVLNQDYRFVTRTEVRTMIAWGPGQDYDRIEIRRFTSATERLVDFSDGSILRAYDLNIANVQGLHIAEEARDLTADTIAVNNEGNLDARGRKIVNLADATDPGDAVTLRQVKGWDTSALNSAERAKESADKAKVSENAAKASEDAAKASEDAAKASEDAAKASEDAAKDHSVSAKASADSAKSDSLKTAEDVVKVKGMSDRFLPPSAVHYTERPDGSPLQAGDRYFSSVEPHLEWIYTGTAWVANNIDLSILQNKSGAGIVGFSKELDYGPFTVGHALKELYTNGPLIDLSEMTIPEDATEVIQGVLNDNPYKWITGGSKQYTVTALRVQNGQRINILRLKAKGGSVDMLSLIDIDGRTSVKRDMQLLGIVGHGNRQNQSMIDTPTEDGGRHGFRIVGQCHDIYIADCEMSYCAGDGIAFFSYVMPWPCFSGVIVERSKFNWNRRHGGAIDSCNGVYFINCTFNDNGQDLDTTSPFNHGMRGARQGVPADTYGNGFDAETYGAGTHNIRLYFINCTMLRNVRSGLLILGHAENYNTPQWRDSDQIHVQGGVYDSGTSLTYSGRASIIFDCLSMQDTWRNFGSISVIGAELENGPGMKFVRRANIELALTGKDASGYHAGVINSDDVVMDLGVTGQPPRVWVSNAMPTIGYPQEGLAPATCVSGQNTSVTNVTSVLIGGDRFSGQTFRVSGNVVSLDGNLGRINITAGGRTLLSIVPVSTSHDNTGTPLVMTASVAAGILGFKPTVGGMYSFEVLLTVR